MGQPQALQISCAGGLNLVATTAELFEQPGYATILKNFESSQNGGYRRINGYTKFGTAQPDSSNEILGIVSYADGVVACVNDGVYFSTDGTTWVQVNTDTWNSGSGRADPSLYTELPRATQGRMQAAVYEGNTEYGELLLCDGVNEMAYLKITGTGGSRLYYYREIDNATYGAPSAPQWVEVYKDHVLLGGDSTNKETVYWSDVFDPVTFTGGNSGSNKFTDKIKAIKHWKDRLFVFGQKSIAELVGINSTPSVQSIASNVGCIDGFSMQEVGGDLVFLSVDGIRTLQGTAQIDDVELSAISREIDPLVEALVSSINSYYISSCVIREKNQYRLYYTNSGYSDDAQKGIIGTYKLSPQGVRWEWSEVEGIPLSCCSSTINSSLEKVYHGGYDGYVYNHDTGDDFNGIAITSTYQSPEINYGSLAVRKTPHWLKLSAEVEGVVENLKLRLRYNFEDTASTHQPLDFTVDASTGLSLYGTAIYNTATYAGVTDLERRILVNGAGYSNKFMFYNLGDAPFSIQSYLVLYYEGGIQ